MGLCEEGDFSATFETCDEARDGLVEPPFRCVLGSFAVTHRVGLAIRLLLFLRENKDPLRVPLNAHIFMYIPSYTFTKYIVVPPPNIFLPPPTCCVVPPSICCTPTHPPTQPPTHLLLRVEGGDEEGLGLHGVPGRKKPSPVVDDTPRRHKDTEVRWSDELHGCEVAGLERSGGNQEVTKHVKWGPSHSPGEWKSPGTLLR